MLTPRQPEYSLSWLAVRTSMMYRKAGNKGRGFSGKGVREATSPAEPAPVNAPAPLNGTHAGVTRCVQLVRARLQSPPMCADHA